MNTFIDKLENNNFLSSLTVLSLLFLSWGLVFVLGKFCFYLIDFM